MKWLLCSYTTGEDVLICRSYFVTPAHRKVIWDGRSPLDADLRTVLRIAIEYARDRLGLVGPVRDLRLTGMPLTGPVRFYYFAVQIERCGGVDTQEVILDLDGRVIEPEIRRFEDPDEFYRYLDTIQAKQV